MIKKNQKKLWLIGLVAVPISTLLACLYYAYKVAGSNTSDDQVGLVFGTALLFIMALTLVVAELEAFLSARFFLFQNTQPTNRLLKKIHKTRLIVSCGLLAITIANGILLVVGLSGGEMLVSLYLVYWFFFFGIKILHVIVGSIVRYKSNNTA